MTKKMVFALIALPFVAACGGEFRESRSIRQIPSEIMSGMAGVLDYQIGPNWGKTVVTRESLAKETPAFQRAAKATARVRLGFGGATAFVIGEKNGETIMATNHHVIEDQSTCDGAKISFEMLDIRDLRCDQVVNTNTDLDLTIFTLKGVTAAQQAELRKVAKSFDDNETRKGMELLTIGYGVAGNDGQRNLMSGQDAECKTFSPDGEVRYMADPDQFNPGPYKTWMFATGCDVSHGDSGSALVDRKTGAVVGILSTGKIPKNKVVRDQSFLDRIFADASEEVWQELTYAVPASKIVETVGDDLP
ncbi:MAG: Trypsin-like peptidase domain [Pseudomonadota bacterium]